MYNGLKVEYIRPDVTIEELPDGRAQYNYEGIHYRLFENFEKAMDWIDGRVGDEAILAESDESFCSFNSE